MAAYYIDILKCFLEKYHNPQITRIITCLNLAMLKIRQQPEFMLESLAAINLAKDQIKKIAVAGGHNEAIVNHEMLEITQSIMTFSSLSYSEVAEVSDYFFEIMPENSDTLESFLATQLNSSSAAPACTLTHSTPELARQGARLQTVMGFYSERFVLKPNDSISSKDMLRVIGEYYLAKGYEKAGACDSALFMEKGEELLKIDFSNFGNSIHVSVEQLTA